MFPADHQRTRLTHALEVAQVAVAIARPCGSTWRWPRPSPSATTAATAPAATPAKRRSSPIVGGYDHAVWGADVVAGPAQPVRRDARRHPQPLLVAAVAGDPRGRGRGLGRPDRLRVPRLRRRRLRRRGRRRRPARPGARAMRAAGGAARSTPSSGPSSRAPSGGAGGHDPAHGRGAGRLPRLRLRPSTCGPSPPARPGRSSACSGPWSTTWSSHPAPGSARPTIRCGPR